MMFRCKGLKLCGRSSDLMVSVLESGSRGLALRLGQMNVLYSWTKHFTLTVLLSTQECEWVLVNSGVSLRKCI